LLSVLFIGVLAGVGGVLLAPSAEGGKNAYFLKSYGKIKF
jgi:hypothetical protein